MCRLLQHFPLLLVPPFTLVLFLQNVLMIRVLDARGKNLLFWFLCPFTCIETKIIFIYTSICPHLRYEIFVRYNQLWWLYNSQIRFIQFVEIKFKNLKQSSGFPNYDLCSPFPLGNPLYCLPQDCLLVGNPEVGNSECINHQGCLP